MLKTLCLGLLGGAVVNAQFGVERLGGKQRIVGESGDVFFDSLEGRPKDVVKFAVRSLNDQKGSEYVTQNAVVRHIDEQIVAGTNYFVEFCVKPRPSISQIVKPCDAWDVTVFVPLGSTADNPLSALPLYHDWKASNVHPHLDLLLGPGPAIVERPLMGGRSHMITKPTPFNEIQDTGVKKAVEFVVHKLNDKCATKALPCKQQNYAASSTVIERVDTQVVAGINYFITIASRPAPGLSMLVRPADRWDAAVFVAPGPRHTALAFEGYSLSSLEPAADSHAPVVLPGVVLSDVAPAPAPADSCPAYKHRICPRIFIDATTCDQDTDCDDEFHVCCFDGCSKTCVQKDGQFKNTIKPDEWKAAEFAYNEVANKRSFTSLHRQFAADDVISVTKTWKHGWAYVVKFRLDGKVHTTEVLAPVARREGVKFLFINDEIESSVATA